MAMFESLFGPQSINIMPQHCQSMNNPLAMQQHLANLNNFIVAAAQMKQQQAAMTTPKPPPVSSSSSPFLNNAHLLPPTAVLPPEIRSQLLLQPMPSVETMGRYPLKLADHDTPASPNSANDQSTAVGASSTSGDDDNDVISGDEMHHSPHPDGATNEDTSPSSIVSEGADSSDGGSIRPVTVGRSNGQALMV